MYLDQQALFNKLPDEVAGKLIKHIFSYVNCEDPTTDDLVLDIAFESIKQALKRDLKSWEIQRKQRSDAGKRSAEARANKKQRESTKSTSVKSRATESTVSVNGNVSVSDKDKKTSRFAPPSLIQIKEFILEKGYSVNAEQFFNHYETNGWMVGKAKMKKWQAALANWNSRNNKSETNTQVKPPTWELGSR